MGRGFRFLVILALILLLIWGLFSPGYFTDLRRDPPVTSEVTGEGDTAETTEVTEESEARPGAGSSGGSGGDTDSNTDANANSGSGDGSGEGSGDGSGDGSGSSNSTTLTDFTALEVLLNEVTAQNTDSWCWAASAAMVMHYHGTAASQCDVLDARFGVSCHCNQCDDPQPDATCIRGGWPDFGAFGFSSEKFTTGATPGVATALPWETIVEEIDAGRPFVFAWAWAGGGGHMMVAAGYAIRNGKHYLWILDPLDPCEGSSRWITYSNYKRSIGEHVHWRAEYRITPPAPE